MRTTRRKTTQTDGVGAPRRRLQAIALVGGAALAAGFAVAGTASAATAPLPVVYNGLTGYGNNLLTPDVAAPGSTLVTWADTTPATACHSATHALPVVLVEGTGENQAENFQAISPLLFNNGYCVYTFNYGATPGTAAPALGDIPTSATELSTVVNKVLKATGAKKVDLVGHSQGGGIMPRIYLKNDGGAAKVDKLIGLAPSNHGTTLSGITQLGQMLGLLGPVSSALPAALSQQEVGSPTNVALDAGGDTVPGVGYTTIVSNNDEVVTPYTQQFLKAGPGATVKNILLQDVCFADDGDHLSVNYDSIALQLMLNALDPAHANYPTCKVILPVVGG